jgi:hypothetical protein
MEKNVDPWALLKEARDFMREVADSRGPCPDCTECDRRDAIVAKADAALAERQAFAHSNVILKERDDGRWCFAITPGELIFPMTTFATKEDALDHADQVAKKNGWPPVYRPGSDPTKVSTTISYDGNVDAVGLGSAEARGMR